MKVLEDMTEPELRALTSGILDEIKNRLPPKSGFVVLFFPIGSHNVWQYGSNCDRRDIIEALRGTADRLERHLDVPR